MLAHRLIHVGAVILELACELAPRQMANADVLPVEAAVDKATTERIARSSKGMYAFPQHSLVPLARRDFLNQRT